MAPFATAAIFFGALVAVQTRINGELGIRLGDGYLAALISFGAGLVVLVVIAVFSPQMRRGVALVARAVRTRSLPWWYLAGGLAGALVVVGQGLTAAVIGVALFSVSIVSGQTLGSLLIDRRGIGTMAPRPLTVRRVAGSALAFVAVVFAVSSEVRGDIPLWMIVLPFVAGIGVGLQQAVNGQLREAGESALAAALINFTVGSAVLVAVFAVRAALVGLPTHVPPDPWLYLGGPIGVVFITGAAALVKRTGVLILGLAMIAGQLIASVLLDLVAPPEGYVLTVSTVVGAALALLAVAIASFPSRATPATAGR